MRRQALLVEDDPQSAQLLDNWVRSHQFDTRLARGANEARSLVANSEFDVAIVDVHLPDGSGLDVIRDLAGTRTAVVTGDASIEGAVDALRGGAVDYFPKPLDLDKLQRFLCGEEEGSSVEHDYYWSSAASSQRVRAGVLDAARSFDPVVIRGQAGTGKTAVTRFLHLAAHRSASSLEMIDARSWSRYPRQAGSKLTRADERDLLQAAERASGGTLCLDDLCPFSASPAQDALRLLERAASQSRFQVVVTTRAARSIPAFATTIEIPSVQERDADEVADLARCFARESADTNRGGQSLTTAAIQQLQSASLPGNIVELRRAVRMACDLASVRVDGRHVEIALGRLDAERRSRMEIGMSLTQIDRRLFLGTLGSCNYDKLATAKILGVSLRTVYNRCHQYARHIGATELSDPTRARSDLG